MMWEFSRVGGVVYYLGVGRYAVIFYVPYSLWNIDRDFTTWYGRWKNLRKNICEFGPFRFVQYHTLEDAWKNPNQSKE